MVRRSEGLGGKCVQGLSAQMYGSHSHVGRFMLFEILLKR